MPGAARLARIFCLGLAVPLVLGGIVGLAFGSSDLATGDELPTHDFGPLFAFNGWHPVLHLATGLMLVAVGGLCSDRGAAPRACRGAPTLGGRSATHGEDADVRWARAFE